MPKIKIETVEQFNEISQEKAKFLLFKHSLTCPVSQEAFHEFEAFMAENDDVEAYYLYVQEARPLSNYVAEQYGVKHESPQALLFEKNTVKWNDSHWRITKATLTESVL